MILSIAVQSSILFHFTGSNKQTSFRQGDNSHKSAETCLQIFSKDLNLSLRGRMTPPDGAQDPHALLRARPSGYKTERSHGGSSCRPLRHHALHGNNDGSCLLHWISNYMTMVWMHSTYNAIQSVKCRPFEAIVGKGEVHNFGCPM